MKILGQDSNGRIVLDGEGEVVKIHKGIPADSPFFIMNFSFIAESDVEPYDELITSEEVVNEPT
jgi:hypothetical protein